MRADCHIHMVLDGADWKNAIGRHRQAVNPQWIRRTLQAYQAQGFSYLRDGGDRWGVGKAARALAPEYGIRYRTPLAPLCHAGHYGSFIGRTYSDLKEYATLVREAKSDGADFIKIMISGLMDFDRFGVLSEEGLESSQICELIHIAHQEGFSVMAHANGARTVEAAAGAGADSIEHGAYLDGDALSSMAENQIIWCPTLSAIGNLRGKNRFNEKTVVQILESSMENVSAFASMGGILVPGSDAGAWAVPHGGLTEYELLAQCLGTNADKILSRGIQTIQQRF